VLRAACQKREIKIPSGKPEGTISCAGKLALAFRLICFRLLENGIGTLISFARNVIRLPRLQRAGPSAFLDKSVSFYRDDLFNELLQSWGVPNDATKLFSIYF